MPAPNEQLRAAREQKHWSQQKAAEKIGVDRKTYLRLETGQTYPQSGTLDLICNAFNLSANELGFDGAQRRGGRVATSGLDSALAIISVPSRANDTPDLSTGISIVLARIVLTIGMWSSRGLVWGEIQAMVNEEVSVLDEMLQQKPRRDEHIISRRQALMTVAALPTALLVRKSFVHPTQQGMGVNAADFLPPCAASIAACWHLLKGDELATVTSLLPQYMPTLTTLAVQPSPHQQAAAALAAQGNILQAIIAMHQLKINERERYCREAVRCAYLSRDSNLTAAALMYLGYTYSFNIRPRRPEQAIRVFHKALQVLGAEDSLLRSDILMGLAEAYAQCYDERKAQENMARAQDCFPTYPENDPSYMYAECGLNVLYQWEGKMYLELSEQYPQHGYAQRAWDALMFSTNTQSINGRSVSETVLCQADAARLRGDLRTYTDYMRDGLHMALTLESRKRYDEAVELYHKTPEPWLKEQPIKGLTKEFSGKLPDKKRGQPTWAT